jgi:ferritin-like metal-binding protein YciE
MTTTDNIEGTPPNLDSGLLKFFEEELYSIHHAVKDLLATAEKIKESAKLEDLKSLVQEYMELLHRQLFRITEIFNKMIEDPKPGVCAAMEGIIMEIENTIDKTVAGSVTRDAALIVALQKAMHYNIASYGSLEQLATTLGKEDITDLLNRSLREEKEIDKLFSDLAEKRINWLAETE